MTKVEVASTLADVERLEPAWNAVRWQGEQPEHPLFTAALRARTAEPFAVIVSPDQPVAAAAGRIERRRLDTAVGYLRVYRPEARVLQLVPGGVVAADEAATAELVRALRQPLVTGAVDAVALPALPADSPVLASFEAAAGPLERQRFIPTWTRRLLVLPADFEAFLASRSRKIRAGVRYDSKKLRDALGDGLTLEIFRDDAELDRLVDGLEHVAATTYQRAVGGGFVDTEEQRTLLRVALGHGWSRAYVLAHDGEPIAYWLCSVHGDTITLRSTGYLPSFARHRPGIYLLMRVIEDACADPALRVLDFGPGRSSYKRHFSSEGYEERNALVFAPTLRGRRIALARAAVLGSAALARRGLDAAGGTERLKTAWRTRLRTAR